MTKISTEKPKAPASRFDKAKDFATDRTVKVGIEATPEPSATEAPVKKLVKKKDAPTMRENFDLDIELGQEMRKFLVTSRRFRTKRDFMTQCLIDGLKKYEGE